jgi:hypothetical protein
MKFMSRPMEHPADEIVQRAEPMLEATLRSVARNAWDAAKAHGDQAVIVRAAQELAEELASYPEVIPHGDHTTMCARCQIQGRIDRLRAALGR